MAPRDSGSATGPISSLGGGAWVATGSNRQVHLAFSFFEPVFQKPPCASSPMLGGPGWAGREKGPGGPALRSPRTPLNTPTKCKPAPVLLMVNYDQVCSEPQQTGQIWATWESFQEEGQGSWNWEDFRWKRQEGGMLNQARLKIPNCGTEGVKAEEGSGWGAQRI